MFVESVLVACFLREYVSLCCCESKRGYVRFGGKIASDEKGGEGKGGRFK